MHLPQREKKKRMNKTVATRKWINNIHATQIHIDTVNLDKGKKKQTNWWRSRLYVRRKIKFNYLTVEDWVLIDSWFEIILLFAPWRSNISNKSAGIGKKIWKCAVWKWHPDAGNFEMVFSTCRNINVSSNGCFWLLF